MVQQVNNKKKRPKLTIADALRKRCYIEFKNGQNKMK